MLALLASEGPRRAELHEVRRFTAVWEREASVRLRNGDLPAIAVYDRHGRIRGADTETACDRAASMWLADHLRGKDVLLLAGSNAEAAELSRRVQARLIQLGTVGPPQAPLADGNHAGTGDLIRARLNTKINADGHDLTTATPSKSPAGGAPTPKCSVSASTGPGPGHSKSPGPTLAHKRRVRLRGQRPRRPGPHRRHRAPPGHRHLVPAGPVRWHDPRPRIQHRARGHRPDRPARM